MSMYLRMSVTKPLFAILLIIISVFSLAGTSFAATAGTSAYGIENCSFPESSCNDYYGNHFEANVTYDSISGNSSEWNITQLSSRRSPNYQNTFGDRWTTENVKVFSPSITVVYVNSSKSSERNQGTNWQYFYPSGGGVNVYKGDNIVMFYYYYQLYNKYGSDPNNLWYPKRYAQNI